MNNPRQIAFLLSVISERGGIGRVTSIISNELNKENNIKVHIISYAKKKSTSYAWNEQLPYHYLLEEQIPMKMGLPKATIRLRKVLTENNIDVLIVCGAIAGPLGVLGTKFSKTKLVYWSHSSFKGSSNKRFRIFNEYFTTSFVDCVISLTKTDQINYRKSTLAKKVEQIYNPIDTKLENLNYVYNDTSNKIISVGRLTYQKNFEALIDVAALVANKKKDFIWDIYGSGEEEDMLNKKIKENGLENKVFLRGQTNKLYELYKEYALMVMTSRYEGFPMSLIEGLASKLPLISFDIPTGPNEIICEGENGYLIKPYNKLEMADKIVELMNSKETRLQFSEKNTTLKNSFDLKSIVNKWIILLAKT